MTIKVLYNLILCRLGIRTILPSDYINAYPLKECGQEMVEVQGFKLRKSAAERLFEASFELLLAGYELKIVSGYRTIEEQTALWQRACGDRLFSADPTTGKGGGHQTGGAVDVILLKDGSEVDMGCRYLEHTPKVMTFSKEITTEQLANRKILYDAMTKAGFANYPAEWWHYCYGDRMWAAYKRKRNAIYDRI